MLIVSQSCLEGIAGIISVPPHVIVVVLVPWVTPGALFVLTVVAVHVLGHEADQKALLAWEPLLSLVLRYLDLLGRV
jgi:hypothetical protein